ncbi:MAG TPA: aldolase/citrate lyase family protein [Spirochaetota bacterium]|jgi:hypothetical protein|nr:MAG: HpcH/HpaI aldolase/citrate lyase family protein [Spirochaetes bacterium ADurb.Bin133]HNZ27889.1 aldolase/citrate lyase family protein [Spirochaetota bacterium]HOF00315.1 aldolase/citrate lyase family protein [Spirochaetota bacterium]HOS32427.1 aldolase/citrate lyase family protein [Spirochaetota bacterium]HOS55830.1 aldolase/citrate lyase family protein [Spirochaetota bacterium]
MRRLREKLSALKNDNSLIGIKGGTEIEAMSFEEIYIMKEISDGIVPMTVKVGGPEARNDIEYMLSIGVDKILAPMVESPYSLRNFVETMEEIDKNHTVKLAINIETIFSYQNLKNIFQSPFFWHIDHVTVGRTDLAGSMNRAPDDPEVIKITQDIVNLAHFYGKTTSVGGKINTNNSQKIQSEVYSNSLNTRHMVVSCASRNIARDVNKALKWESDFYLMLREKFPLRVEFYNKRIADLSERMAILSKREADKVCI